MKIKRYLDKDMRRVLQQVRAEQGPDAVILSNRRVPEGIEVIAAIDYDESLVRHAVGAPAARAARPEPEPSSEAVADDAVADDAVTETPAVASVQPVTRAAATDDAPGFDAPRSVRDELTSLRGLLETQMAGLIWKDTAQKSPLRAQVLRNLARLGVAPDIASRVIEKLEPVDEVRRLWHGPITALAPMIPVREDPLLDEGGVIALVGPTGVGKTTSIAKIAARYAMRHGDDGIALISADAYRIGAREHLSAFANIIGANVYTAGSTGELSELLSKLRHKRLVLIDTEGRSPRDRHLAERLAAYGSNSDRVRFYLTLSASSQSASIDEAIRNFRRLPLEGCIVTKIDEAAQLGGVISSLIRNDLPACWFSDGQQIPDDLHPAARKRMWLLNQAVDCLEHNEPAIDEQFMAANYATGAVAHA